MGDGGGEFVCVGGETNGKKCFTRNIGRKMGEEMV